MKIYVSGLYSGGNPQPGVGIIRSLRQGFPNAVLVGVEYSNRVSGIHWEDLDDLWIQRPWDELDLDRYGEKVRTLLDGGAFWISGSDLEAMWLAEIFPDGHRNLLAPPAGALRRIGKPEVEAHEGLPVRIPTWVSTDLSDWDLHAFCRKHNWRVWLKGPYYDAARTPSWDVFEAARNALTKVWSTSKLFLQAHVGGYEESVMLSAYKGELLGAVSMRKRDITPEGKTWAGDVCDVPEDFLSPLRRIVKELNWTGGGELEMVRDPKDQLWLLEWNPRFPAWVHGATIGGYNLPARLVQRASGVLARTERAESEEFTRVVLEVPVRPEYPLPPLPEPFAGAIGHSMKHPSGLPSLAERLHKRDQALIEAEPADCGGEPAKVPETFLADLSNVDFAQVQTPEFLFLETTARSLFEKANARAYRLGTNETRVVNAYSIKTNPDPRLIRLARENGFLAEGISLAEIQAALKAGFSTDECILNGPGKWWPENMLPDGPLHAVFSDSIADLERTIAALESGALSARHVGIRIRTPNVVSRFGIPLDSPATFRKLVESVKRLPSESKFGVHFHMASANIGVAQWWHLFESILKWCRAIEKLSGRTVEILDMGGGWFPDDWHDGEEDDFAKAVETVRALLPGVRQIVSEPGKAMAQPSMALAMRVLEIQEHEDDYVEAVVDGSIAELPMYFFYPHRILRKCGETGQWQPLTRGKTHLMGRLCMEHDVVAANVRLPEGTQAGDLIVFCDAGGYDRSMSYVFGRG